MFLVFTGGGGLICLFVIQVVCEVWKTNVSPGSILKDISVGFIIAFEWAGRQVAFVSSYLKWIHLKAITDAALHLTQPITDILFSWTYFFRGYIQVALSSRSIYIGSLLLIFLIGGGLLFFTNIGSFLLEQCVIHWMRFQALLAVFALIGLGGIIYTFVKGSTLLKRQEQKTNKK